MNLGGRLWTQLFNVRHSHCPSIFHVAELLLSRDHPLRCPAISGWNAAVTVKKRGGLWVASESSSKIAELYGYSSHKQISGWWLSPTPLKNDGLGNSWDDEIPNWMESHKIPWFKITNQKWFVIHFDPFRETVINPQGPNNFGTGHRRGMARPTRPTTDFHSVTLSKIPIHPIHPIRSGSESERPSWPCCSWCFQSQNLAKRRETDAIPTWGCRYRSSEPWIASGNVAVWIENHHFQKVNPRINMY